MSHINKKMEPSPAEVRICMWIGARRDEISRAKNRKSHRLTKETTAFNHGIAALGEYMFCKMHNLHFDLNYDPEPLPKEDCIWGGLLVDVKTCVPKEKYITDLQVYKGKAQEKKRCDLYVLMLWKSPIIKYCGFARAEDVFKSELLREDVPLPCYQVPRLNLVSERAY